MMNWTLPGWSVLPPILELAGASCYSVILSGDPVGLDEYLPHLHRSVRAILDSFQARSETD